MHAPVSVAMSTIASTPSASAYTSASASVSRPSASVLITSIVLPFDAVSTSPGRIARSEIMFSHAATMKWTSTPAGLSSPIALAAPSVAAEPPQSNFISSIIEPAPACSREGRGGRETRGGAARARARPELHHPRAYRAALRVIIIERAP